MTVFLVLSLGAGLLTAVGAALWAAAVAGDMGAPVPEGGGLARMPGAGPFRMPGRRAAGVYRVAVIPCPQAPGCFRWSILSPDGTCVERSDYAYATPVGAGDVGAIRLREAYPSR